MSPTSGCSIPAESATKLAELALGAEGLSLEIQRRCVLDGMKGVPTKGRRQDGRLGGNAMQEFVDEVSFGGRNSATALC